VEKQHDNHRARSVGVETAEKRASRDRFGDVSDGGVRVIGGGNVVQRKKYSSDHLRNENEVRVLSRICTRSVRRRGWVHREQSEALRQLRKQIPPVHRPCHSPPRSLGASLKRVVFINYGRELWARRVAYQVEVSGGGFVLAEVDINGHMAPVIRWRRAHDDGRTAGNFSDEPGEADPRRKRRERWNCPFQNLIRAGVRPGRAVADVARGFHDMLTNAVGRFLYRNLILFRTGYVSQLFEVGDEGANFCLTHGWWQHVLPPNVEPLQQHCLGFLCHGGCI
jgi:hypothetical protein